LLLLLLLLLPLQIELRRFHCADNFATVKGACAIVERGHQLLVTESTFLRNYVRGSSSTSSSSNGSSKIQWEQQWTWRQQQHGGSSCALAAAQNDTVHEPLIVNSDRGQCVQSSSAFLLMYSLKICTGGAAAADLSDYVTM
jgi:hypothetical protein